MLHKKKTTSTHHHPRVDEFGSKKKKNAANKKKLCAQINTFRKPITRGMSLFFFIDYSFVHVYLLVRRWLYYCLHVFHLFTIKPPSFILSCLKRKAVLVAAEVWLQVVEVLLLVELDILLVNRFPSSPRHPCHHLRLLHLQQLLQLQLHELLGLKQEK
jgi:hypothetical protein